MSEANNAVKPKRGRPRGSTEKEPKITCPCCGKEFYAKDMYGTESVFNKSFKRVPYCKDCVNENYYYYVSKYESLGYAEPEKKAIERVCMALDMYFCEGAYDAAIKEMEKNGSVTTSLMSMYIKHIKIKQYRDKTYDNTIHDRYAAVRDTEEVVNIYSDEDGYLNEAVKAGTKLFGKGFSEDEYVYMYEQYCDWTSRHECNTKAQEEVFKNICITQLQLLKATRAKEDTKDLSVQLQRWLEAGKLQPKQNSGDTMSEAQTFGTLIDKWENTRPLPEIDKSVEDIDRLGMFVDVLMRGHLAKTAGINGGYSRRYEDFIKKYSVETEEYDDDEENNAIYEALFGSAISADGE